MIEIKFGICDEVVFLNTATGKFDKVEIASVRVIPTEVSNDENGKHKCDGYAVLYETANRGPVLTESEAFATEEEARAHWKSVFAE